MFPNQTVDDAVVALGHVESAPQPVPDRQRQPEVDVDVLGRDPVVALVLGGTGEDAAQPRPVADPDVRMAGVGEEEEGQVDGVEPERLQRPRAREKMHQRRLGDADQRALEERAAQRVDRMLAVVGERRENFDRVVHAVEGPDDRNAVREQVPEEGAEVEGDEDGDGQEGRGPERAAGARGRRPGAQQPFGDEVAAQREGSQPAAEEDLVDGEIPGVGPGRRVRVDLCGEEVAPEAPPGRLAGKPLRGEIDGERDQEVGREPDRRGPLGHGERRPEQVAHRREERPKQMSRGFAERRHGCGQTTHESLRPPQMFARRRPIDGGRRARRLSARGQ